MSGDQPTPRPEKPDTRRQADQSTTADRSPEARDSWTDRVKAGDRNCADPAQQSDAGRSSERWQERVRPGSGDGTDGDDQQDRENNDRYWQEKIESERAGE